MKRKLRIVKRTPIALGICDRCNMRFQSHMRGEDDAEAEISAQFDGHKCKPLDSSQNALRIVEESTKDK